MPLHLPRLTTKDRLHSYHGPFKHLHRKHTDKESDDESRTSNTRKRAETESRPSKDLRDDQPHQQQSTVPSVQTLSLADGAAEPDTKTTTVSADHLEEDREQFFTPTAEPGEKSLFFNGAPSPEDEHRASFEAGTDDAPRKKPFPHPESGREPIAGPGLTPDQAAKYADIHTHVSKWITDPPAGPSGSVIDPLSEDEQMWLSRECLLRYLRATSWNVNSSVKRLLDTMLWRREFGVTKLTADGVSKEAETGKMVILGYDNNARPCLYMNPGRQNTEKGPGQIEHLVYLLERTIEMMDPGQETTALLINFKGATSGGSPSIGQGKQVLGILQGHYPERLGRACISDLPWYINTFFKVISPFIDPVTREKMIFNDDLRKHIPPSQLDSEFGGDVDFKYDHAVYWPMLTKLCDERRAEYKQRWIDAGKAIGEYEGYMRGGPQKCLSDHANGSAAVPVDSNASGVEPRVVGE